MTSRKKSGRKHFGDRRDGRRVRSLEPMTYVAAVVLRRRNDAVNFFEFDIDMIPIKEYIKKKRMEEHLQGFGFMHVLTAAFVRMISQYPGMNRFIAGNKIYHRNDIIFSMMVKREMSIEGQETGIKVKFEPTDTAYDVYKRMSEAIEEAQSADDSTALDNVARMVTKMPTGLLKTLVDVNTALDYCGLMPKIFEEASPFHASFFISNLGSLGIPPVHHHIYNFGNVSTFLTFGKQETEYALDREGNVIKKQFIKCKASMDERITDGYYMAQSFKYLIRILKHPELLDIPPEVVVRDVD